MYRHQVVESLTLNLRQPSLVFPESSLSEHAEMRLATECNEICIVL